MTDRRQTEEKEIETVAERSRTAAYIFLACAAVGFICAVIGIALLIKVPAVRRNTTDNAIIITLLAVGAVLIAVFSALYVKKLYRPYVLIAFKDGMLVFPDGTACSPKDVTAVECDRSKLTVTVDGMEISVNGVADIDRAARKLKILAGLPVE